MSMMFDAKHIETLLEKYWEAETSPAEESLIAEYMQTDDVASHLLYAKPYFNNIIISSDIDFETSIMNKLLDKYFEAETSVDEEAILKEYFAQDNVHESLRQYKSLFNAFSTEASMEYNKSLSIPSVAQSPSKKQPASIINMTWMRVAVAALFIGVVATFFLQKSAQSSQVIAANHTARVIEPETPEEALKMTMQALAMVSRNYKKGEENLLNGMKTMNETNIMRE